VPRFGKEKDSARKEELDRQAAEEVERLTRRAGPPTMGGGGPNVGQVGIPSPLERIAAELRDAPRPSMRRQGPPRKAAPQPQQAFTPMPSGSVGSSFGPGGLNPGPRTGVTAPPPSAFGGAGYDEDYGGAVTGPPVYNAGEPDEEEEMSITELALMDHAAHTGHSPEDLVIQYDAGTAEEMRDQAMRQFYERQQSRRPGAQTSNPFAPAGMRGSPGGGGGLRRPDDPATAGGALAQRLANRRRREEAEARQARGEPDPSASPSARAEPATDEGALARVLARRRQSLGVVTEPEPAPTPTTAPAPAPPRAAPGRRHAEEREQASPGMRVVPVPVDDEPAPARRAAARKGPAEKAAAPAKKAGRTAKAAKAAAPEPVAPEMPVKKAKKGGATLVTPPAPAAASGTAAPTRKSRAKKAGPRKAAAAKAAPTKAPVEKAAARNTGTRKTSPGAKSAAKAVFCIECGEKNPAIAKFCFNCGTRLAAPES
jgi:hypothetical protein